MGWPKEIRRDLAGVTPLKVKEHEDVLYSKRVTACNHYVITRHTPPGRQWAVSVKYLFFASPDRTYPEFPDWRRKTRLTIPEFAASAFRRGIGKLLALSKLEDYEFDGLYHHVVEWGNRMPDGGRQFEYRFFLEEKFGRAKGPRVRGRGSLNYQIQGFIYDHNSKKRIRGRCVMATRVSEPELLIELDKALAWLEENTLQKLMPSSDVTRDTLDYEYRALPDDDEDSESELSDTTKGDMVDQLPEGGEGYGAKLDPSD